MLEYWMGSGFVEHSFQSLAARFDKTCVEASNCLLLWWGRNNYPRIIVVQGVVQPQEVPVPPTDCEFRLFVCF